MKLRYIGTDKLYELTNGEVYRVELFVKNSFIWVKVEGKAFSCPYATPMAFANNWEAV